MNGPLPRNAGADAYEFDLKIATGYHHKTGTKLVFKIFDTKEQCSREYDILRRIHSVARRPCPFFVQPCGEPFALHGMSRLKSLIPSRPRARRCRRAFSEDRLALAISQSVNCRWYSLGDSVSSIGSIGLERLLVERRWSNAV
jgi:hypothetical protein